jgi:hypothetical protein
LQKLTPLRAIKLNCVKCAGSIFEVKRCDYVNCPLFIYRLGHNPARRGIGGGLSNFKKNLPTQVGRF